MTSMHAVTKKMEISLGPDTGKVLDMVEHTPGLRGHSLSHLISLLYRLFY